MNTKTFSAAAIAALAMVACGNTQFVKGATINSATQGGDEYADVVIKIDSSALNFPAFTLPIVDPANLAIDYGTISLGPDATSGVSDLSIDVDLTQALKLPTLGAAQLPNGTALPILGLDTNSVLSFAVGSTGSKIYLELDTTNKKAAVGTALVVPEINIGVVADLFIPFQFSPISGTAGVFTGRTVDQSGFGVFADLSGLFTSSPTLLAAHAQSLRANVAVASVGHQVQDFRSVNPGGHAYTRIQSRLYDLSQSGRELHIK